MLSRSVYHAVRGLVRSPRYTVAVVLTLGLAVGANTAVFAFVRSILLRPLPLEEPDRVALVTQRTDDGSLSVTSPDLLGRVAEESNTLEAVAGFGWAPATVTGLGDPFHANGASVDPGYFRILGQPPILGREFTAEERGPNAPQLVLISHRFWQARFDGDPAVLGRTLRLDDSPHEIIGVLPAGLMTPDAVASSWEVSDLYRPAWWATGPRFSGRYIRGVARLAEGVSLEAANDELAALAAGVLEEHPTMGELELAAVPIREYFVGEQERILLLVQLAVLFVLLIAAVNVMNLTLARGIERSRELAVHSALGAGRGRLVRLVLGEVLVAGAGGGLLGVLLAVAAVRIALAHAPPDIPQLQWVRLDGPTFAAAGGFTLLAALIAGVVPGLRLTGRAATRVANAGYRATDDRRDRRLQAALVASQVALAATLLVGAGLLVRSFSALTSIDMGYTIEGIRMMRVDIPPDGFDDLPSRLAFVDGIRERLAARPEVAAVAFGTTAPQHGLNNYTTGVTILDRVVQEGAERPHGYIRAVTPGYFDVFGLSIEEGRGLNSGDVGPEGARAVVVSRAFAERFLPDGAIGQRLVITGDTVEVVGLTAGMRFAWPGEPPEPEFFLPYYGRFSPIVLVARGPNDDALARAIRAEVRATDRRIPLDRVPSLRELFGQTVAGPRFAATLLTLLAAIAVGIAALGIYSVLSFLVARRRREIGVRIALGATAGAVRRMLLAHGGRLAALGLIGGLALAWSTGQLLEGFLFEVTNHDPVVFVGVPVALGLVALAASLLPALRATRVDPATSIREDA